MEIFRLPKTYGKRKKDGLKGIHFEGRDTGKGVQSRVHYLSEQ